VNSNPTAGDNHPFTIALTGGIASGKTLVSDEFASLGVPIIDTDVIAHEIVEPGQAAFKEIENSFGSEIVGTDGRLKRAELRALIFSDPDSRTKLEAILHPRIRLETAKNITKVTFSYCILVIPLLAEKGLYANVNRILVVDVSPETQIKRLMNRDNCSYKQAQQALASQTTRDQRLSIADDVLDNSGLPDDIAQRVAQLHRKYMGLANHS
jgi:dephospho-CoA kinase